MGKRVSGRVGTVARFKPLHLGHATVLETLCEQADELIIGLGSSNVYDLRNPFTAQESREMIDLLLKGRFSNYSFVEVPDFNDGPRWRIMANGLFGKLDYFVTANDYVQSLLEKDYAVVHPIEIVPEDRHTPICGTMVRVAMAQGNGWEKLVPSVSLDYIRSRKIDERFCREFGLATLAADIDQIIGGRK